MPNQTPRASTATTTNTSRKTPPSKSTWTTVASWCGFRRPTSAPHKGLMKLAGYRDRAVPSGHRRAEMRELLRVGHRADRADRTPSMSNAIGPPIGRHEADRCPPKRLRTGPGVAARWRGDRQRVHLVGHPVLPDLRGDRPKPRHQRRRRPERRWCELDAQGFCRDRRRARLDFSRAGWVKAKPRRSSSGTPNAWGSISTRTPGDRSRPSPRAPRRRRRLRRATAPTPRRAGRRATAHLPAAIPRGSTLQPVHYPGPAVIKYAGSRRCTPHLREWWATSEAGDDGPREYRLLVLDAIG